MESKCKAIIIFADDYGDNECTFHCELKEGHEGNHKESGKVYGNKYILIWESEQK